MILANEYRLSYTASDIDYRLGRIDDMVLKSDLPTKTSDLTNDSNYATEAYVIEYAQPAGDYALRSEIHEADLSKYALKTEIPTDYLKEIPSEYITESELTAKGYLTEQSLYGLATESYVDTAIEDALAQAKESGEFDGSDGYSPVRGTDYWTEADKAEIKAELKAYIDEAIANAGGGDDLPAAEEMMFG